MSNNNLKARNKRTGEIVEFEMCYSRPFCNVYINNNESIVMGKKSFNELYELITPCDCLEKSCQKDCTRKHTCHTYWCDKCCEARGLPKSMTQEEYEDEKKKPKPTPETWQDRFNTEFVDEDTGLLNIGKYDHERLLTFINNEIK